MSTHPASEVDYQDVDATIGEIVHRLMWKRRLTQTALAPMMGLSQSVLGKKLRGEIKWFAHDVFTVAQILDVPVETLFPGQGSEDAPVANVRRPQQDSNLQPTD